MVWVVREHDIGGGMLLENTDYRGSERFNNKPNTVILKIVNVE